MYFSEIVSAPVEGVATFETRGKYGRTQLSYISIGPNGGTFILCKIHMVNENSATERKAFQRHFYAIENDETIQHGCEEVFLYGRHSLKSFFGLCFHFIRAALELFAFARGTTVSRKVTVAASRNRVAIDELCENRSSSLLLLLLLFQPPPPEFPPLSPPPPPPPPPISPVSKRGL